MAKVTSYKPVATGSYTVTAGDVTATYSQITTDLLAIVGLVVTIVRSGVVVGAPTMAIQTGANVDKFRISTNGATYVLTAGDIVSYVAF